VTLRMYAILRGQWHEIVGYDETTLTLTPTELPAFPECSPELPTVPRYQPSASPALSVGTCTITVGSAPNVRSVTLRDGERL
jgi:hypothetical protein